MPGRFLFFFAGGAVGSGTDRGGPEEEQLTSAEPELETVMAEEFSISIGMAHTILKALRLNSSYFLSFFPTPIPN